MLASIPSPLEAQAVCERVGLVGCSAAYRDLVDALRRCAGLDATVLLEGATGTGKELAARALHYLGRRRGGPFVPVDCGALPETLFEGELFGHARGAFTDARRDMHGLVAQARGGTLFIDEIHTLAPRSQAALLRFLQDHRFRPLGGEQWVEADVRVVAAANRSLEQGVREGWFRGDLYFRLNVVGVRLSTLAERAEDVPMLVHAMLARLAAHYGVAPRAFDAAALAQLCSAPWPGNVRELENVVHRSFLQCDGEGPLTLPGGTGPAAAPAPAPLDYNGERAALLCAFEAAYLRRILTAAHGNVTQAARLAGKERRLFGRMLKRQGIARADFQDR
ncbi:sigma-54 dependent transcriptional regulator [Aquincola sp. MAHUQ-54]|uniref:Sigma-54 dependent transcriptional regulator n=1 Tax=Aquincola agrisoli TaxID=3119538 RepID=A0AAW9QDB1_9BURK